MSTPLSIDSLLARYEAYLPTHQPFPTLTQLKTTGAFPLLAVVTCADPRCNPEHFLGIHPGEVVVFRNAGGNIQMALPNILAIDALIGIKEVMVVKHTDCGSLAYTENGVKGVLKERAPGLDKEIDGMELGSIAGKTLEQGLKEQVGFVKKSELLRGEIKGSIRAFVHDIVSGSLTEFEV